MCATWSCECALFSAPAKSAVILRFIKHLSPNFPSRSRCPRPPKLMQTPQAKKVQGEVDYKAKIDAAVGEFTTKVTSENAFP